MEHLSKTEFNNWSKIHITDDSKFDDNGNIIMENSANYKHTGIIAKIFEDHFNEYYNSYKETIDKLRPNAREEVQKIIDCANHNLGVNVYICDKCGDVTFSSHTCKGKLCSSCGIKTQKK